VEPRGPAIHDSFAKMGGRGDMIKAPIDLQDLRRRIYAKAKAEPLRCLARRGFGWKRWSSRWLYEAELRPRTFWTLSVATATP
jgi:hypothetical protein